MIDLIGTFRRIKRPWRLGQQTMALLGIGELAQDLSLATMPPGACVGYLRYLDEKKIQLTMMVG